MKSRSWSSVRVHGRKSDKTVLKHTPSWRIHRNEEEGEDDIWRSDYLSRRSLSSSALLQRSTVFDNAPSSCNSTPRTRRKSVKQQIFGRLSSSTTLSPNAERPNVANKSRTKSDGYNSMHFSLYLDAIDQCLLAEEDLAVWEIQEKFPNDDLKLYEGIFGNNSAKDPYAQVVDQEIPMQEVQSPEIYSQETNSEFSIGSNTEKFYQESCQVSLEYRGHEYKNLRKRVPSAPETFGSMKIATRLSHSSIPTASSLGQYAVFSKLSPSLQAKFRKMAQRRQSAPSIVIRGVLGRSSKLPASLYNKDDSCVPLSPINNSQRLSLKFGSHGAMLNLSKRQYVMEGKVQLTTGMQTQDRYMFLFTDLLLIAKAKSGSNYKLKYRIRVCELWIATCLDEVSELTKSQEKSFVIGWPTTNCVATFSSSESKALWHGALIKKINDEKEKESPKTTTLKVISRDQTNTSLVKLISISHTHTARDVVRIAMKEFGFEENEEEYQLWVMSRKEGTAYPLIGHENPHAIQISHVRDAISANGIVPEMDVTSISEREILAQQDIRNRCQFVLRSSRNSPTKLNLDQTQRRLARIKNKTPAAFFNWARKRHATSSNAQRQDSTDSGLASMSGNSGNDGSSFSSSPPLTSSPVSPKLFSRALSEICENGEVPAPVASMLDVLYRKAPYTTGIFRKSANARTTRLLKEKLNDDTEVAMSEVPIHVIAALFKDFLRNIPNSVLNSGLYQQWTEAIDKPDDESKMMALRTLLKNIYDVNRLLVRRLAIVLNRIASHSKRNNMTSFNLSVCIAPSLLWPPASAGPFTQADATRKVTEILQFMVDRCNELFDGIVLNDACWPPEIDLRSEGEENDEYEGELEKSTIPPEDHDLPEMVVTEDEQIEEKDVDDDVDDESDVNHFNRSRMIRRQLQRRRPQSRSEATRIARLSQDSLDQELNDDDMIEGDQAHMQGLNHRTGGGTDACSMSNDSGFTTLSGEDEDTSLSVSNRRKIESLSCKQNPDLLLSSSMGSNLYEMMGEDLDDVMQAANEEFRNLWDPSMLVTLNGEIVEDGNGDGLELRPTDDKEDRNKKHYSNERRGINQFRRRRSQPEFAQKNLAKASSVGESMDKQEIYFDKPSRLVAAITTPSVEYAASSDNETADHDGLTFALHNRQQPTYVRLNDANLERTKEDDGNMHVLAKEYLKKLRSQSTCEVLHSISSAMKSLRETQNENVSTTEDKHHQDMIRPCTLSLNNDATKSNEISAVETKINHHTEKSNLSGVIEIKINVADSLTSSSGVSFTSTSSPHYDVKSLEITRRRFNSLRTNKEQKCQLKKAQSTGADIEPRHDLNIQQESCLSPIQKLTENLNSFPNFRQQSRIAQHTTGTTDVKDAFSDRKKASSLRINRSNLRQSRALNTHYVKTKTPLRTTVDNNHNNLVGTSFKATSHISPNSSAKTNDCTTLKNANSDTNIVPRRRRARISATSSVSQSNHGGDGENIFSKSLPSDSWRQRITNPLPAAVNNKNSSLPEDNNKLNVSTDNLHVDKDRYSDNTENSRCRRYGIIISHEDGKKLPCSTTSTEADEEKYIVHSFSSASGTSSVEDEDRKSEPSSTSVKSKISAFNHLISNHTSRSNNSSSLPSSMHGSEPLSPTTEKEMKVMKPVTSPTTARATFVHLETMLSDFQSGNYHEKTERTSDLIHVRRIAQDSQVSRKPHTIENRNGLIVSCESIDSSSGRPSSTTKRISYEKSLVKVKLPEGTASPERSGMHARRPSPQPLSDNILFSLSESFAFGNRKSPRCLTPTGTPTKGNTPRESPVFLRRRVTEPTTARLASHITSGSEKRNKGRKEIDRTQAQPKLNRNSSSDTAGDRPVPRSRRSLHTDHKAGSVSHPIDKSATDANSLLPIMGFEKVIYSEESYV